MGEAQKHEGFRFAEPALLASGGRMAAELNLAGLVRMERQREDLEPITHRVEKATSGALVLEAGHQIIGIAHDDHVALGLLPSPASGPEVEDVVQVDVGKARRDHRPLSGFPVVYGHDPVFEDARLQVSRPAGLHRQPLVEPSVTLSRHWAPIRQTRRSFRCASVRRDQRGSGPAFLEGVRRGPFAL
jgi:hypothetical protein